MVKESSHGLTEQNIKGTFDWGLLCVFYCFSHHTASANFATVNVKGMEHTSSAMEGAMKGHGGMVAIQDLAFVHGRMADVTRGTLLFALTHPCYDPLLS